MTVADAAQAVQHSADGSLYARWEDKARILAIALTGEEAAAIGCAVTNPPSQRGDVAISALVEGVAADWGDGHTVTMSNAIEVSVADTRSGWQYAHWLVSYAAFQGIERVRYGDQVWTSKDSSWRKAKTPATNQVIAEVFH
jgi:hypothetical protein